MCGHFSRMGSADRSASDDIWPTETAPVFRRREDGVELVQLRWGIHAARHPRRLCPLQRAFVEAGERSFAHHREASPRRSANPVHFRVEEPQFCEPDRRRDPVKPQKEVEALNTTTIRRLTPSCRHQLLAIAHNGLEQTATLDALTMVAMFGNIGTSEGSSMPSNAGEGTGQ